jgi:hypothetical protein
MSTSARNIVELNIRHYRKLLQTETDLKKREMIRTLLAEEEARLAAMREYDQHEAGKARPE